MISIALSAVLCLVFIPLLARYTGPLGLMDEPSERKQHIGNVPVVGGIAIYLSAILVCVVLDLDWRVLAYGAGLILIGAVDDIVPMSVHRRVPVQIATALAMVFFGGLTIESVGNLSGAGNIVLSGALAVIFTVVCTVGVINSINMIDGVDGLLGTILFITLCPLAFYCWRSGDKDSLQLMMTMLGALVAFLFYNSQFARKRATIFMGDSGSMLFGFILVWYFISLTQSPNAMLSPVSAGWILGLPLVDTLSVIAKRLLQKRSPLDADREHLHHILLDAKMSANAVVLTMGLIQLCFVLVGMLINEYSSLEPFAFWLFLVVVLIYHFGTPRVLFLQDN